MRYHIAILAHADIINTIQNNLPFFNFVGAEITYHVGFGQEAVSIALELQRTGVDGIVTGQHNFKLLKNVLDIPVITYQITYEDLLLAVRKGLPYGQKMCIVTTNSLKELGLGNLKLIEELAGITLNHVTYSDKNELEQKILELKKTGFRVIIGTPLACFWANKHEMKSIDMYGLESGIQAVIRRTVEIIENICQEEERAKKLKTILDYAHDGIIMSNHRGFINFCNSAAVRILRLEQKNILNIPLSHLFKSQEKKACEPQFGIVEHIGDIIVVANHTPVKIKNQLTSIVSTFQDITKIQELENEIRLKTRAKGMQAKFTFEKIIGKSIAIHKIINSAKKYAESDFTILIEGETGCGKEIFAQGIHNHSKFRFGPFVAINCSALPENLLESELFGYDEGAFTGARSLGKKGLFEVAHNGSIFLDEISSISPSFQSKLLRVIQEREIMRVGSDKIIPVNVRIIAATNDDLGMAVSEGKFRSDLYFRLSVLTLKIPPLRQRREDIPVLFKHFMKSIDSNFFNDLKHMMPTIVKPLLSYNFPGNIRELINIVQRFLILLDRTMLNDPVYLTKLIRDCIEKTIILLPKMMFFEKKESLQETLEEVERKIISQVLKEENNDKTRVSRRLGLSRATLYRKISTLKIMEN